jgi:hypothetical protein
VFDRPANPFDRFERRQEVELRSALAARGVEVASVGQVGKESEVPIAAGDAVGANHEASRESRAANSLLTEAGATGDTATAGPAHLDNSPIVVRIIQVVCDLARAPLEDRRILDLACAQRGVRARVGEPGFSRRWYRR